MVYRITIWILLLCINLCGNSQGHAFHFDNYTSRDGLPSSEVYCIMRDSRNFLWFSTDHGVAIYDGYSFKQITLPDNTVFAIREDRSQRVWFATYTGQLFYYENDQIHNYRYNDLILKEFPNQIITDFLIEEDRIHIAFMLAGYITIDNNGNVRKETFNKGTFLLKEINNSLFTAIYGTGQSYKEGTQTLINVENTKSIVPMNMDVLWARKSAAIRMRNGTMIAFFNQYLIYIDKNDTIIKLLDDEVLSVSQIEEGNFWIGFLHNGIAKAAKVNGNIAILERHLQGVSVTSITEDHETGVWFSTLEKGVFYLRSKNIRNLNEKTSTFNNRVSALAVVRDSLLVIASAGAELQLYNPRNNKKKLFGPVGGYNSLFYDKESDLLVVVAGHLPGISATRVNITELDDLPVVMFQANSNVIKKNKGSYVMGRHDGLFEFDLPSRTITKLNGNVFRVSYLDKDDNNSILAANQYGLWKFLNQSFQLYDPNIPMLQKRITCIQRISKQNLLLGTRGYGLIAITGDSVYSITTANGLVNNNIRKILYEDSNILVATNKGISKIYISSFKPFSYSIANLSYSDGLTVSGINDIVKIDSLVYVGSDDGVSYFNEALELRKSTEVLPFYFTSVKVNDKSWAIQDVYDLNYRNRDISMYFTALSFRASQNIQYRYRIKNLDTTWVYTYSREIRLTSMPYGEFTVEVQASVRSENWNVPVHSMIFKIAPPFWKSWWFISLMSLFVLGLAAFIMLRKIAIIKNRELQKTLLNKQMVEMEIRSLRAQMNPHFTFNVLQSVQYFITHNNYESAQKYLAKFSKLMRKILDNSKLSSIPLEDEIQMLKDYLELEKLRFENSLDYSLRVEADLDQRVIMIPTMLIQPHVENAIKHGLMSNDRPSILQINFSQEKGNIVCVIEDNGIGRARSAELGRSVSGNHHSSGITLVEDRIKAFNKLYGKNLRSEIVDLFDKEGFSRGTMVLLTIPLVTESIAK